MVWDNELAFHLAVGEGDIRHGSKWEPLSFAFTKRMWKSMAQNRVMGTAKPGVRHTSSPLAVVTDGSCVPDWTCPWRHDPLPARGWWHRPHPV